MGSNGNGNGNGADDGLLKAQVLASLRRTREKSAHSLAAARRTQEVAAMVEKQADSDQFRTRRFSKEGGPGAAPPPAKPDEKKEQGGQDADRASDGGRA